MPKAKRGNGMRGKSVQWPWSDRGRSAVTLESVRADLERLLALLPAVMQPARYSDHPPVVVKSQGWK